MACIQERASKPMAPIASVNPVKRPIVARMWPGGQRNQVRWTERRNLTTDWSRLPYSLTRRNPVQDGPSMLTRQKLPMR